MKAQKKFAIGSFIIVATLIGLAYVGYTQSKTYYHTIKELATLSPSALHQRMRVSGVVENGSIQHLPGHLDFVLQEEGKVLPVSYVGTDPLPDTFKDGAQALVEGNLMSDGRFRAEQVQAKCASKYQASPMGASTSTGARPGETPPAANGVEGASRDPSYRGPLEARRTKGS
ncbi:MAG TPA: cytochrome c maturation protein CcmE [Candidatus Acidoferrales bacterium]|nr:cytochrome c maturation protein CcmE [Candidatus Acidoferrales bacterium]